ncbi:hypothetical protein ACKVWC_005374 [Pyricularia oryzae]
MASQKDLEAPVQAAHTSSQQSFNLTELPRVGQNQTTDKQVERITNDLALLQAIDKPPMPRQDDLFEHKRRQARVRDARRNGAILVLVSGMNAQEAEEYNRKSPIGGSARHPHRGAQDKAQFRDASQRGTKNFASRKGRRPSPES